MKISLLTLSLILPPCFAFGQANVAAEVSKPAADVSLRLEVQHAVDKGLEWLRAQQTEEGYWGDKTIPALTALPVAAVLADPTRDPDTALDPQVDKALDWLVSNVKRDGGIYGKGLANYNTSVSLMALLLANRPKDEEVIRNARRFLVNQQQDFGERGKVDHPLDGGIGYGSSYAHSDLSNTHLALEALYYSKHLVADEPAGAGHDLNWDAAIAFVSRCQNLPETNPEEWASDDPKNKGGFIYFPGDSKAGTEELANGKTALRSYGSMGYAGLLAFIYADLDKDDVRYKTVMEWLGKNFSLEENPGMDAEGLFYYYHTMAKALALATKDGTPFTLADGSTVNWRAELAKKLFDHQRAEGFWVNDTKRWWEGDPILTSSYSLLALEHLYAGL